MSQKEKFRRLCTCGTFTCNGRSQIPNSFIANPYLSLLSMLFLVSQLSFGKACMCFVYFPHGSLWFLCEKRSSFLNTKNFSILIVSQQRYITKSGGFVGE